MNSITLTPEQRASIQTQTTCGMCLAIGEHCDDCPTTAMLVVPGDPNGPLPPWPDERLVAPKKWTDLTGECVELRVKKRHQVQMWGKYWRCVDCSDVWDSWPDDLAECVSAVPVATASVEVLPVVGLHDARAHDVAWIATRPPASMEGCWYAPDPHGDGVPIPYETLPVPGRDWVVALTDIEPWRAGR